MNLVRAELRRLVKRRIVRWTLVVVVLVLGAVVAGVAVSNEKIDPEVVAAAEARAEAEFQQQRRLFDDTVDEQIAQCEREQADPSLDDTSRSYPADLDCEEIREWGPRLEYFDAQWYLPPTFEFRERFGEMIMVFAALLSLFGFLVGASFVGAEWRSGGMMNLLLWRPRRLQVLGAKLGIVLGSLLGLGLALGAFWTAAFWLVASSRGVTDTMTAGAWESFALAGVRGLVLVLVAGALGFALASIGRHTALALGTAVGAVVIGLFGALLAAQAVGAPYPEAWLWSTYLLAWLDRSVVLTDWNSCNFAFGECQPDTMEVTWQAAGIGIGAVSVVLVAVAVWQMRRRDVT